MNDLYKYFRIGIIVSFIHNDFKLQNLNNYSYNGSGTIKQQLLDKMLLF